MANVRLLSLIGVVAGLMLGVGVLSLGSRNAQAEPTIEGTVNGLVEAWNDGDAEAFIAYFTPEAFERIVGYVPTVGAAEADMEETGPIASADVSGIKLGGGVFTAVVDLRFDGGFSVYERWTFEQADGGWIIVGSGPASRPIPAGVPTVDMTLQEYAFNYNAATINAADGNFAFSVTNAGEEEHEIVIFKITGDKPILDLLESADPESEADPEGLEFFGFGGFFAPGTTGTAVFDQPFSPGTYGLVCFIPSPDGVPHAFLGMVSEFTVSGGLAPEPTPGGSGGGITPPNTGDAGLLGSSGATTSGIVLGLALMLVLGGTAGLARSRRS